MQTHTQTLVELERLTANGVGAGMLCAGHVPFEPTWQNDADCEQHGWYSDIHGTLMAPVSTDWNQHKPYIYLDVFMPDAANDPQYGFVYAGKAEVHVDKGQSIAEHNYTGSPGKTNEWRSIVNRAQPHEIIKHIVSVHETVDDCRAAEKRLIIHLWDKFGRVDEGGVVTNLSLGIEGDGGNRTPEECAARSRSQRGKPNGRGQSMYIREKDGTEYTVGNSTEAGELVSKLTGKSARASKKMAKLCSDGNRETLSPHGPTGLLICFEKDRHNPMRKTHGARLVRLEGEDGVEIITADQFMERFDCSRQQLIHAVAHSRRNPGKFRGKFAVTWGDGAKQLQAPMPLLFNRVTGESYDNAKLVALGLKGCGADVAAKSNAENPFVYCRPKGIWWVYADDMNKPITPSINEKPIALLQNGLVDGVEVCNSMREAGDYLGRTGSSLSKTASINSKHIKCRNTPPTWGMTGGTHVVVYLHDLSAYCGMTGQEMPLSLMWYVPEIAKWREENPHPNSKAAKQKRQAQQGAIMAPQESTMQ